MTVNNQKPGFDKPQKWSSDKNKNSGKTLQNISVSLMAFIFIVGAWQLFIHGPNQIGSISYVQEDSLENNSSNHNIESSSQERPLREAMYILTWGAM